MELTLLDADEIYDKLLKTAVPVKNEAGETRLSFTTEDLEKLIASCHCFKLQLPKNAYLEIHH